MEKKEILARLEESLRSLYADLLVEGHQLGFDAVDFFLEQCVVTTKPEGETTQQRVIAIISAEWAWVTQNFNNCVGNDWLQWQQRVESAKIKLVHLPQKNLESEAKKMVKNYLIKSYGIAAYNLAKNSSAYLVRNAKWDQIDTLAKSICEKLEIQPDHLTLLMVAGSQKNEPFPQEQGLCCYGHELRFCLVDDVNQTIESYFYEREITQDAYSPLRQNPNEPKPSLREILRAKPVVVGQEKSFPNRLKI